MAIYTRAEKAARMAEWKKALDAVMLGQEYTIGSRTLKRADLKDIQDALEWLEKQPAAEDEAMGMGRCRIFQGTVPASRSRSRSDW